MAISKDNIIIKERRRWLFLGLPFTFETYTLTDKILIIKKGFLTTTEDEVKLYRIVDMTIHRSIWQKIFGLGTLQVNSKDQSSGNFELKNIKHVREFRTFLTEYLERDRSSRGMRGAEMIDSMTGFHDPDGMHDGDMMDHMENSPF